MCFALGSMKFYSSHTHTHTRTRTHTHTHTHTHTYTHTHTHTERVVMVSGLVVPAYSSVVGVCVGVAQECDPVSSEVWPFDVGKRGCFGNYPSGQPCIGLWM